MGLRARLHREALDSMKSKFSFCGKRRRARGERHSNGFTLMELLIVISIIVILMLIAIPTSRQIRKHTNELSAQNSLRTIEEAESMYATDYPVNGFACSLQALSGDASS